MKQIIIIGGGIAGLTSCIQLAMAGLHCTVIEKKSYPFHRVCGEYISNEARPFLSSLNIYPEEFSPSVIKRFQLSSTTGRSSILPLNLGGFGISRYTFDQYLFKKATDLGVVFRLNTEVEDVKFIKEKFEVYTKGLKLDADVVMGSFGKRSRLDVRLERTFIQKKSPFVGVKYHIRTNHSKDLIALHNFTGGYCGISNIEDDKTNLCYLSHRDNLKKYGSVDELEKYVLFKNPLLKGIFENSQFLFNNPEVINEISFETKQPIENHMLMTGDAAGMITPLCGNGMAMAIHSGKIACTQVIRFCRDKNFTRALMEKTYEQQWNKTFAGRLWKGRQIQRLFGNETASNFAVGVAIRSNLIAQIIIRNTHGEIF